MSNVVSLSEKILEKEVDRKWKHVYGKMDKLELLAEMVRFTTKYQSLDHYSLFRIQFITQGIYLFNHLLPVCETPELRTTINTWIHKLETELKTL